MRRFFFLCSIAWMVASTACASSPEPVSEPALAEPERRDLPFEPQTTDRLRVLLVGDTGHPSEDVQRVRRAMLKEEKDVIVALGDLARFRRRSMTARVVVVTGSSGKTTSK